MKLLFPVLTSVILHAGELSITINHYYDSHYKHKTMPLTALECQNPGAVKHIHTINIPLNQATLVLSLVLHDIIARLLQYICTSVCCTSDASMIRMAIMVKWRSRLKRGWAEDRIVSLGVALINVVNNC